MSSCRRLMLLLLLGGLGQAQTASDPRPLLSDPHSAPACLEMLRLPHAVGSGRSPAGLARGGGRKAATPDRRWHPDIPPTAF